MLKVSDDGRRLLTGDGSYVVAAWEGTNLWIPQMSFGSWALEDAVCLADFINSGPPKKQWKITRIFEFKPTLVQGEWLVKLPSNGIQEADYYALTDLDIEEV